MGLPDGPHLDDREDRREHAARRGAAHRTGLDARKDGRAHALLLAHLGGPAHPTTAPVDREGRITLSYTPNNDEAHKRLVAKLKGMLKEIRCHDHLIPLNAYIPARIPLAGVAHQNGTVRFGRDPKTSALDVHCKAHEVDNLYVVDASFFPSSCAVNPALTIMANALRVGDHVRERLG